jgi:hypothetical protein
MAEQATFIDRDGVSRTGRVVGRTPGWRNRPGHVVVELDPGGLDNTIHVPADLVSLVIDGDAEHI